MGRKKKGSINHLVYFMDDLMEEAAKKGDIQAQLYIAARGNNLKGALRALEAGADMAFRGAITNAVEDALGAGHMEIFKEFLRIRS